MREFIYMTSGNVDLEKSSFGSIIFNLKKYINLNIRKKKLLITYITK